MLKKYFLLLTLLLTISFYSANAQVNNKAKGAESSAKSHSINIVSGPKYIFYFIGDGMGHSIVNITEYFNNGAVGNRKLSFTQFPNIGFVTTHCDGRYITDSAAAGTALATGNKTSPGAIGVSRDGTVKYESVAKKAKLSGYKVGIITSVSIDHATPAAFYAHNNSRSADFEIAKDGIKAGLDIYAGSGFLRENKDGENIFTLYKNNSYTIIRGKEELKRLPNIKGKLLITESKESDNSALKYKIDKKDDDLSLNDLVKASVDYFMDNYPKDGFFMMVEGGKIDWASHGNDARTAIGEVVSMDEAVKTALDFYNKYPTETLIIVTADHDTGGPALGVKEMGYDDNISLLTQQKVSFETLNKIIFDKSNKSWGDVKIILKQNLGFWNEVEISESEATTLEQLYTKAIDNGKGGSNFVGYAISLLNTKSGIGWTTDKHTGIVVPIYSIGVGAENFAKGLDNTEIPTILEKLFNKKGIFKSIKELF